MPKDLMTPDGCANALVAVVQTVAGIGLVYPERKVVRTEEDIQKWLYHEGQNRINGWFVTLAPTGTATTERGTGHNAFGAKGGGHNDLTTLRFQIEGYFGIANEESSELTFRNLAFAVMNEINSYGLLGFAQTMDVVSQGECNIDQLGYAVFAQMMPQHYTNLSVSFLGRCH